MADVNVVVDVFDTRNEQEVGKIALNGYNISEGGVFGNSGAMRSFKIVEGEMWPFWNGGTKLKIVDVKGGVSHIRIFAMPAETGGSGFVEFI